MYLKLQKRKGIKSKQWSGYRESHTSQPLSDNVPLIYAFRILKDIDRSTMSNNLLTFSSGKPLVLFGVGPEKGNKVKVDRLSQVNQQAEVLV